MIRVKLNGISLSDWTGGYWLGKCPEITLGISHDSRLIEQGFIFIALSYSKRDGHDFISDAVKNGAKSCIVEKDCKSSIPQLVVKDSLKALEVIARNIRENFKGNLIAVTGSCGKTSTKDLLTKIIGESDCYSTKGNLNNYLGVPLSLLGLNKKYKFSVIEAGISEFGEMSQLSYLIKPNIAIFTHIGEAHLKGLISKEKVAEEKAKLFDYRQSDGLIIAPYDVLKYKAFKKFYSKSILIVNEDILVGFNCYKKYSYSYKKVNNFLTEVKLITNSKEFIYSIKSFSRGMVQNSVLAVVAAIENNIKLDKIYSNVRSWKPSVNRGEIILTEDGMIYVDCYNANPSSMKDSLSAFIEASDNTKRRTYFIGTMNDLGEHSLDYHELVGKLIEFRKGDRIAFFGKEEKVRSYIKGVKSVGWTDSELEYFSSIKMFKSMKDKYTGSIFLKGSRSCELENLIPVLNT